MEESPCPDLQLPLGDLGGSQPGGSSGEGSGPQVWLEEPPPGWLALTLILLSHGDPVCLSWRPPPEMRCQERSR